MSLVEHLAELRRRLIIAVAALMIGAAIGFLLYNRVLHELVTPYCHVKHHVDPKASCRLVVPPQSTYLRGWRTPRGPQTWAKREGH